MQSTVQHRSSIPCSKPLYMAHSRGVFLPAKITAACQKPRAFSTQSYTNAIAVCSSVQTQRVLHPRKHSHAVARSAAGRNLHKTGGVSTERNASAVTSSSTLQAKDVVIQMYDAYNTKDINKISELLSDDCSYHDLAVYQDPFIGRPAIVEYFAKVMKVFPEEVKFVIDDVSGEDPYKCGVMWHMEVDGVLFPFTRGCSFYTVNSEGKISQARDLVEPPFKSGAGALEGLKLITPLVKLIRPGQQLPIESTLLWMFYALYSSIVLFSNIPPGQAGLSTPPESLQTVFDISINFFYVNIALDQWGFTPLPSPVTNPVYEGLFNFVCAWSMMFLPVILTDKKSQKVQNKVPWWLAIMFVTNVFFIPFLALRAAPEPEAPNGQHSALIVDAPALPWSPVLGWLGLGVGALSIGWVAAARPEFGDLAARWDYFLTMFNSDRVFWAFILDMGLYGVWQANMLEDAEAQYKFVPFFGLAAWLINGRPAKSVSKTAELS